MSGKREEPHEKGKINMSARNDGGGAGRRKAKDSAMAQMLKKNNVQRLTQQCPICNVIVSNTKFYTHVVTHN